MDSIVARNRKLKQALLRDQISFLEIQKETTESKKTMLVNTRKELKELQDKFGKLV